ncbi:hypothetical protein FisN_20Lh068 [Fistulifera solaris]|uniref:HMG box domain-containing protein n=1 Tax=Fistulifera solaris TaxID=1519565 RepID=A0A1Z5JCZ7_FISSO|nr:hypothetical protein FisN_20Lh068 [Fistulifera solaris]|eukprot:GAX11875.1 hypothetical protein FisN_20Lh068 [Fistulifera solaris]
MVQDIRTEQVLTELDMTSAKSESALWSILGFYFSIIFGLLAVLILLKTIKLGRWLDFTSSVAEEEEEEEEEVNTEVEKPATPAKATKSPAKKTEKANLYALPPKNLNGSTKLSPARITATKKTASPTKKSAKTTTPSTAARTPPRGVQVANKTPTSKRSSEAVSTTGRKRAKRDPHAPKRPKSAYLLFQNEKRAELSQANPQMSSTEVMVLVSHLWKNVYTEAQKQPYLDKETALKEQYKIESAAYQASKKGDEAEHVEKTNDKKLEKSPRRPKDPNAPKRPKTAFLVFNSDAQVRQTLKAQFPAASPQEIMRLLGERWATMTPHDKQPYEEIAQQEHAVYKVEKEAYDQKKAAVDVNPQAQSSDIMVKEAPAEKGGRTGFWENVSNLFNLSDVKEIKKKNSPTTKKTKPSSKTTPVKAKTTPAKKKTLSVPILSSKRALRSGKRKTRSSTP